MAQQLKIGSAVELLHSKEALVRIFFMVVSFLGTLVLVEAAIAESEPQFHYSRVKGCINQDGVAGRNNGFVGEYGDLAAADLSHHDFSK